MSSVAAIGEADWVEVFTLGGVAVSVAENDDAVRAAWDDLDADVVVLIVTPRAADALAAVRAQRPRVLWAVMPA